VFVAIVGCAGIGDELAPFADPMFEIFSFRSEWAIAFGDVFERAIVGGDHSSFRAHFDRHVADRHAAAHGKRADRVSEIFSDVSGCTGGTKFADDGEDDVFCGDTV